MWEPGTKVTPRGQKFLVQPMREEQRSKGGIVIPDSAENKPIVGRILAVGDGEEDTHFTGIWPPKGYEVGALVLYGRWSGTELPTQDLEADRPRIIGIDEVQGLVEPPSRPGSPSRTARSSSASS